MTENHPDNTAAPNPRPDDDMSASLGERVRDAAAEGRRLRVIGGDSKAFYGQKTEGEPLALGGHRGIVHYEPTELVLTARAGTPLAEVQAVLDAQGQMLAFDPPAFGPGATLGGTIATGLSGPRRPYTGAARDFVLGTRVLTGKGQVLSFGGEVMKNVAGYDVSRLMTGALGTLGVLLEISLKVLPRPAEELTLVQEQAQALTAITQMNRWAAQPLPLSAACYDGDRLYLRLSGTPRGVAAARARLGGEVLATGTEFWHHLREHTAAFFADAAPLWRLSVNPTTAPLDLPGKWLLDWGGAQRWLRSEDAVQTIRAAVERAGGHATLFRAGAGSVDAPVFHPLPAGLAALHRQLKRAFDPDRVLNPGRLYPDV